MNKFLEEMAARPKNFRVLTHYVDGSVKTHDVHSQGQADNWATGERRKIGRDLLDRTTGKTVRVTNVTIERLQ